MTKKNTGQLRRKSNDNKALSKHYTKIMERVSRLPKVTKKCIFCGKKPLKKSKEHVIPDWLIRLTGNENRKTFMGFDEKTHDIKELAFDQFVFPACEDCNNIYGNLLEDKASVIMKKLLKESDLSENEFNHLLTWFDKIRLGCLIGIWTKSPVYHQIEPKKYIGEGLNNSDMYLRIYKSDYDKKRLHISGIWWSAFMYVPVCFCLNINQYYFIFMSSEYLVSRRLGLPFPGSSEYLNNGIIKVNMQPPLKRIFNPIIKGFADHNCVEIFQPVMSESITNNDSSKLWESLYFSDEYTKSIFMDKESRRGALFFGKENNICKYSSINKLEYIPETKMRDNELRKHVFTQMLKLQNFSIVNEPSLDNLSDLPTKKFYKRDYNASKTINNKFIKMINKKDYDLEQIYDFI